jgi:Ca2+-binding EF-hand superfamily protein
MSKKADNIQTAILLFSKYDKDGDGSITKEELKAMLLKKCEDEGMSVDPAVVEKEVKRSTSAPFIFTSVLFEYGS